MSSRFKLNLCIREHWQEIGGASWGRLWICLNREAVGNYYNHPLKPVWSLCAATTFVEPMHQKIRRHAKPTGQGKRTGVRFSYEAGLDNDIVRTNSVSQYILSILNIYIEQRTQIKITCPLVSRFHNCGHFVYVCCLCIRTWLFAWGVARINSHECTKFKWYIETFHCCLV